MKKQQKWIVSITLLLIMALALVACGGGETAEEPARPPAEAVSEGPIVESAGGQVPASSPA